MENKLGGSVGGHFEPPYEWQHQEGLDLLLVHLPELKDKEGLKVQVSNCGILRISGDYQINHTRLSFFKEIRAGKDHNIDEIKAKFEKGVLKITLPKKVTTENTNGSFNEEYGPATTSNKRFIKIKKVAVSVVVIMVVLSALSGFAYYMYRSTIVKD